MVSLMGCCAGAIALVPARPGLRLSLMRQAYRRPRQAWLVSALLVMVLATMTVMPLSVVLSAAIVGLTGWFIARSLLRRQRKEQQRHQLATVLNLVTHQLRSGAEPGVALRGVVRGQQDMSPELREQLLVLSSGAAPAASIPELHTVARVWEAARHHGIALAPLLGRVQSTLEKELRHGAATRARLVGPQSTAVVLSLLPLGGVGLGTTMGANPVSLLFGGGSGGLLLMAGTTLMSLGALWSQALIERAGGQP
ncbi:MULTISPECIES: hypothetical protein [unclassified Corynebacterium]|uniref:type II secretion system F family protein n=1 Tax=unclassified Corynebacterium TaxID=2624378 RepID=UPI0029CA540E|nr:MULTISPECIES: hypothetical protein [unclassified Corynebacterium]WPF66320.1 hypothetical protein OLX12_00900 [Corynebacterium sp. 22KM0430]WPF68810.1 hypothetical protein OLW90_00900 [Corynebacterium sp. 21KM1197]